MSDASIRLAHNPDGSPNIEVRGRLLHSKHNPLEEARRFLTPILSTLQDTDTLVILGFGAGYLARALFELRPLWTGRPFFSGKVLFVENEPALLRMGLEFLPPDVKQHVRLLPDLAAASRLARGTIRLVSLPAHRALFPELHRTGLDDSTRHRFFRVWTANALRRLHGSLTCIAGPARIPPASLVYCGAGPQLFSQARTILDAPVVAAADTALAPLLHAGIVPDVVLSIDAGPGTLYHLQAARRAARHKKVELSEIPVFTWLGAHAALESCFNTLWFYRTTFPIDQILGSSALASIPEQTNESRNTAGLAVILAAMLSIRRVDLAGTGYVSKGTVTHVPGTGYDLFACLQQSRLKPAAGYRPGSYKEKLSGKHRMSSAGLEAMADRLSIQLHTAPTDSTPPNADGILRARRQLEPVLASFSSQTLCESLLGRWTRAAGQLSLYGLSSKDIARRQRQLLQSRPETL